MQASKLSKTKSSRSEVLFEKMLLLKILQNSEKKHLCQSSFFDKVADWRPTTLSNTGKIFNNTYFGEHLGRLLPKKEQLYVFIHSLAKLLYV